MLLRSKGEKLCFKWTSLSQTVPNGKQTGTNDKTSERERDREKLVTVEKDSLVCGHSSGGHMGLSDSCDQVDCSRYCQYTVIILNEWKRNLGSDRILIKYSDCYEGVLLADSDPVLQRQTEVRSSMERTVSQALFQWLTELSEGDLQRCAVDRLDQHTCSHRVTEWAHRAQASVWSDSYEYEDTQNKPKDATSQQRHTTQLQRDEGLFVKDKKRLQSHKMSTCGEIGTDTKIF